MPRGASPPRLRRRVGAVPSGPPEHGVSVGNARSCPVVCLCSSIERGSDPEMSEGRGQDVERGSDKHSPVVDDQLKHETEGLVRAGHSTHAEEWKEAEPSGEDQPDADLAPSGTLSGGVPDGMDPDDVEGRAELAGFIGKAYPMVREQILDLVMDREAPTRVVDLVRRLPAGREFENINDVWTAAGGHVESD